MLALHMELQSDVIALYFSSRGQKGLNTTNTTIIRGVVTDLGLIGVSRSSEVVCIAATIAAALKTTRQTVLFTGFFRSRSVVYAIILITINGNTHTISLIVIKFITIKPIVRVCFMNDLSIDLNEIKII